MCTGESTRIIFRDENDLGIKIPHHLETLNYVYYTYSKCDHDVQFAINA